MVSQSLTAPPSKDDAKGWYGAARTMAKKMVSDQGESGTEKRDADACLLACRRCARTLGHALFWANDASIADELRLSVLTSIALADLNESETSIGLAVAARDDALHALVCLREWSRRQGDASPCTLQLVKNLYAHGNFLTPGSPQRRQSVHGGIAAKKAADAIAPCINGKDATQCFALLAERLDERLGERATTLNYK